MKTEVRGPKSEMQDKASERKHSDFPTSDIRLSDIRHQISNST